MLRAKKAANPTSLLSIVCATCAVTFYLWVGGAQQIVANHCSQNRLALFTTLLLLLAVSLLPVSTVAHDAGTFTVIVKENSLTPNNPQLVVNDSAWWYNVDSRENITHRIVWDSDGDGLYNGTNDWDSGNLSSECEKDEFGNQTDSECKVTFEIPFNGTWGAGTYNYQDIISNGTVHNGTITVMSDSHTSDGTSPPSTGYEFNNDDENQEPESSDGGNDSQNWLLLVAGASGFISLLLIGLLIVMGPGKSILTPDDEGQGDNDLSEIKTDSDIDDIAEEE